MTEKNSKKFIALEKFSLNYENPSRFVCSPWKRESVGFPFLMYRIIIATITISMIIFTLMNTWHNGEYFIFLTNWGMVFLVMETVLGASIAISAYRKQQMGQNPFPKIMPLSYKIYWVTYNVALAAAFFITTSYWIAVYNPNEKVTNMAYAITCTSHIGNTVISLIEIIINDIPTKVFHVIQPIIFGSVYTVFSITFYLLNCELKNGNKFIYTIIDWNNVPKTGSYAVLNLIMIGLFYIATIIISKARNRIIVHIQKVTCESYEEYGHLPERSSCHTTHDFLETLKRLM